MFDDLIVHGVFREDMTELPPMRAKAYEYWMAGNGLFLRAANQHVSALVPLAHATVRGLGRLQQKIRLRHSRLPGRLLRAIVDNARKHDGEQMYLVVPSGVRRFRLVRPRQIATPTSVVYESDEYQFSLLDLHSHGRMRAFFSGTDDGDDVGLRFYGVLGKAYSPKPEMRLRLGIHGHRVHVPVSLLFTRCDAVKDLYGRANQFEFRNGG